MTPVVEGSAVALEAVCWLNPVVAAGSVVSGVSVVPDNSGESLQV
jgi:hypothetical protein